MGFLEHRADAKPPKAAYAHLGLTRRRTNVALNCHPECNEGSLPALILLAGRGRLGATGGCRGVGSADGPDSESGSAILETTSHPSSLVRRDYEFFTEFILIWGSE